MLPICQDAHGFAFNSRATAAIFFPKTSHMFNKLLSDKQYQTQVLKHPAQIPIEQMQCLWIKVELS
jgi:hypothetical protein